MKIAVIPGWATHDSSNVHAIRLFVQIDRKLLSKNEKVFIQNALYTHKRPLSSKIYANTLADLLKTPYPVAAAAFATALITPKDP